MHPASAAASVSTGENPAVPALSSVLVVLLVFAENLRSPIQKRSMTDGGFPLTPLSWPRDASPTTYLEPASWRGAQREDTSAYDRTHYRGPTLRAPRGRSD